MRLGLSLSSDCAYLLRKAFILNGFTFSRHVKISGQTFVFLSTDFYFSREFGTIVKCG